MEAVKGVAWGVEVGRCFWGGQVGAKLMFKQMLSNM